MPLDLPPVLSSFISAVMQPNTPLSFALIQGIHVPAAALVHVQERWQRHEMMLVPIVTIFCATYLPSILFLASFFLKTVSFLPLQDRAQPARDFACAIFRSLSPVDIPGYRQPDFLL